MLRANVGLSRKVSRDYQSTGYTVNIDGEIPFLPDDAEGVLEKIRELFDIAHEALDREVDRDQGDAAVGRRDETPQTPALPAKPSSNGRHRSEVSVSPAEPVLKEAPDTASVAPNGSRPAPAPMPAPAESATNKQIQFILTMGKRFKMTTPQLEERITKVVGRRCGVYDLTKKEAGRVLDSWTTQQSA
jgi:hypothetical protein